MATLTELRTRLAEAEAALHELQCTGLSQIMVGSMMRMYDLRALQAYVASLKVEIAQATPRGTTNLARLGRVR